MLGCYFKEAWSGKTSLIRRLWAEICLKEGRKLLNASRGMIWAEKWSPPLPAALPGRHNLLPLLFWIHKLDIIILTIGLRSSYYKMRVMDIKYLLW